MDQEAYADVKSIHEAMERREAACYLRRTQKRGRTPSPSAWEVKKCGSAKSFKKTILRLYAEQF